MVAFLDCQAGGSNSFFFRGLGRMPDNSCDRGRTACMNKGMASSLGWSQSIQRVSANLTARRDEGLTIECQVMDSDFHLRLAVD